MQRYNPKDIEPKWQKIWDETGVYTANLTSNKPKYIAMSMFNYPSGAGIHIGHAMNYTISDVKARFKRQQGHESYHPVGWDAFGLPAENYAIKAGVSPQESMANIIPMYHKQYKAMGWSNDWEKEIATHLPEYYRWTQWIFTQMHKAGLVYQDSRMQWWCAIDNTVLANEQVIDGKCWRHDGADDPLVEKKEVKQWFFKITEYADELLEATEKLDWTESVKLAQKNWIGRSEGMQVQFKLAGLGADNEKIDVYTTAHDTIFGATFMVFAPEHPLIAKYLSAVANNEEVQAYIDTAVRKSEVDREAEKTKTGVQVQGLYAVNPINGETIPVWIADYVLMGYGTGAVMAVPGEDERDYEFANNYGLPVIYTTKQQEFINYQTEIKNNRQAYQMANSGEFNDLDFETGRTKIQQKLEELGAGAVQVQYKMRDWSVSRQRYWGAPIPVIHCQKCGSVLVPDEQLPVILPELQKFEPSGDGRSALARAKDWLEVVCPQCGGPAERETDTMDTYVDSSWYMFRYFDPHNQEKIFDDSVAKKWEPIDFYNGADHATAHLLYARFITRFFYKQGLLNNPEPFKQFVYNGKVIAQDGTMFSKSKGNGVDPLEVIDSGYGADALRTYLMFAAPLELWAKWDPQGVPGTYRFLNRLWNIVQEYHETDVAEPSEANKKAILKSIHEMIKKTTIDLEENRYNTAISAVMKCLNDLYKLKAKEFGKSEVWQQALESAVACIAPFAPHVADELWLQLGHSSSIHQDSWPKYEEKYLASETITIVVQVNGKVRANLQMQVDSAEDDVVAAAKAENSVSSHLNGEPKRIIYIPNKLLNFVI
jgi:leucyl-tRNA synthetase